MKHLSFALVMLWASALSAQTEVQIENLKSKTPADWKAEEPMSKFRQFQFSLPKADGDKENGELYVTDFGGGGIDANIGRWKGFFNPPEGKSIDDATKIEKFKVGNFEAVSVDISGTYKSKFPPFAPNAKEVIKPNFRRVHIYITSPEKAYFIILSGPAATIEKHHKGFSEWVKNFK